MLQTLLALFLVVYSFGYEKDVKNYESVSDSKI